MLPNFFVVGAQKAGTTSLHQYLSSHPSIYLPAQKETKFFVKDEIFNLGITHYELKYFSEWAGEKAVGEVDPDYMFFENALDRITEYIKQPRFVFVFRNPVDRAFSNYLMTYRRGREQLSFENAISEEPTRIRKGYFEKVNYSYVTRGFYAEQVERFLVRCDISRMLFLLSDDLFSQPKQVLRRCFEFLEVDPEWVPPNIGEQFHRANVPRSMTVLRALQYQSRIKDLARLFIPSEQMRRTLRETIYDWNRTTTIKLDMKEGTRKYLHGVYQEPNQRLGRLIGRDLSHWNNRLCTP